MERWRIAAPMEGKLLSLYKVPEEQFAQGRLGPGVAVIPKSDVVVAPFEGTVSAISHTGHAIMLENEVHAKVLIQIGMDSGFLHNVYFEAEVEEGEHITEGQILLRFDRKRLKKMGYSPISPVVLTNPEEFLHIQVKEKGRVRFSEEIITFSEKEEE